MEHQRKPTLLSVYQMESLISFHAFSIRIVLRQVFSFVAKSKLPRRRGKLLSFCLSYVKPLVSFNRLQLLRINKNSEQKLNFVTLCTQSHTNSRITKVLLKWTGCCKITWICYSGVSYKLLKRVVLLGMSLVSKSSLVNLWVKLCIGTIPCVLKWESLFKVSHWYYWCVLYRIGNA